MRLVLAALMVVAGVETYGWGFTMVVAGSVFAIGGALATKPWLSMVGGSAMVSGFFAPWIDPGHISGFDLARQNGVNLIALAAWAVPLGGTIAMIGASRGARGRGRAVLGGAIGLGAIAYLTYRLL